MAKRETKAGRRAREDEQRKTIDLANAVAGTIYRKREGISASPHRKELNTWIGQVLCESHIGDIPRFLRLVADVLEEKQPYSPANYCGYDNEIATAYKDACMRVRSAFVDAWHARHPGDREYGLDRECGLFLSSGEAIIPHPSRAEAIRLIPPFYLFLDIFRERNPKLHGASSNSLRRSLRRLGLQTVANKPGRPKPKASRPVFGIAVLKFLEGPEPSAVPVGVNIIRCKSRKIGAEKRPSRGDNTRLR
jgi:hypothetical protein